MDSQHGNTPRDDTRQEPPLPGTEHEPGTADEEDRALRASAGHREVKRERWLRVRPRGPRRRRREVWESGVPMPGDHSHRLGAAGFPTFDLQVEDETLAAANAPV